MEKYCYVCGKKIGEKDFHYNIGTNSYVCNNEKCYNFYFWDSFAAKAIQLLELTKQDPKNKGRVGEFEFAIEELIDYFLGNNVYSTTDEMLRKYYDAFVNRC